MGIIHVEGMEFYAFHGHFKEEQLVGNKFIIDLKVTTDLSKPAQTDELDDTVDYQRLYALIKTEMKQVSNLLEHVAGRIMNVIWQEFVEIKKLELKVSKINPPLGGKISRVSISMQKER